MRRQRTAAIAALIMSALTLMALTVCSAAKDRRVEPATMTDFRVLTHQPTELDAAEALATQRCMRARGFEIPLPIATSGNPANLPARITPSTALTEGYGDRIRRGTNAASDPIAPYAERLSVARRAELDRTLNDASAANARITTPSGWEFGASRRGCVADGRTAVYGSVDNFLVAYYLPQDLNLVAADAYLASPVREAARSYTACMAHEGFTVEVPQDAVDLAQAGSVDSESVSAKEIALATADATCQAASHIVDVWEVEFERAAIPWIAANAALIGDAAKIVRAATGRARTILPQLPPPNPPTSAGQSRSP